MYPDMLLLTPEFSFLPSVFRKPVTAKKSSFTVAHLEKRQVDRMQSSSNATFIERHHFRIVATIDERSATTRRKSRKRKTFLEQKKLHLNITKNLCCCNFASVKSVNFFRIFCSRPRIFRIERMLHKAKPESGFHILFVRNQNEKTGR